MARVPNGKNPYAGISAEASEGSSLKAGTSEVSGLMIVLIVLSIIFLVVGLFTSTIYAYALFAAAAVLGILARIAQAGRQHAELMDELRRRS